MKQVFGKFVSVLGVSGDRVPMRAQARTIETVRVCPSVSEVASDRTPNIGELVCDFLPIPTK